MLITAVGSFGSSSDGVTSSICFGARDGHQDLVEAPHAPARTSRSGGGSRSRAR